MPFKDPAVKAAYNKRYQALHPKVKKPGKRALTVYETRGKEKRSVESWAKRDALKVEYQRDYHLKNQEARNSRAALRYKENTQNWKDKYLKHQFGISLEQYCGMLEAQHGVCAICKQPETTVVGGKVRALAVDHDHATGAVRSLLCGRCNKTLGAIEDSPPLLHVMIQYLEQHSEMD